MQCPSFQRIIDFIDNRLSEADAAGVADHLRTNCSACVETRDWYQRLNLAVATDDMTAPPPWVLKRAIRIAHTQRARSGSIAPLVETIASLIFDSHARPALASVRSAQPANRQLLYRTGDYNVDLQIAPSDDTGVDLLGQVLKDGEATFELVSGLKVEVARDGKPFASVVTNDSGEFKVSDLTPGNYELRVELSERGIIVLDLPLNAS